MNSGIILHAQYNFQDSENALFGSVVQNLNPKLRNKKPTIFPVHKLVSGNNYSQAVLKAILLDPEKMVEERLFSTLDLDSMEISQKVQYKEPSVL